MNQEQAVSFINALNALQMYVPPFLFDRLTTSPVCKTLVAVANGTFELQPKSAQDKPSEPAKSE